MRIPRYMATLVGMLAATQALLAFGAPAPPLPVPVRVATADAVVLGEVIRAEEKKPAMLPLWGGDRKLEHFVVVIKVREVIHGPKGLTHIRVAHLPPARGSGGIPRDNNAPKKGEDVMLFLRRHPGEPVYVFSGFYDKVLRGSTPSSRKYFTQQVEQAKRAAKVLKDPDAALRSEDEELRYTAAAVLIHRYRTPPPSSDAPPKLEPIPAERSELILKTLANAEWDPKKAPREYGMQPSALFSWLGVTKEDGFVPPKDFRQASQTIRKWLKENASTYRIRGYVR